jgi:uncharacterized protein (UPF0254 family)
MRAASKRSTSWKGWRDGLIPQNRAYLGEICYRREWKKAKHTQDIDLELFNKVQERVKEKRKRGIPKFFKKILEENVKNIAK